MRLGSHSVAGNLTASGEVAPPQTFAPRSAGSHHGPRTVGISAKTARIYIGRCCFNAGRDNYHKSAKSHHGEVGLHGSYSVRPSPRGHRLGEEQETWTQSEGDWDLPKVNRKRCRCPSGWLFRVWGSRLHRDGGIGEGALGLGCRSRAHLGVPRTGPSCPCCVAAAPELFIECRGQGVQSARVGATLSQPKSIRESRGI